VRGGVVRTGRGAELAGEIVHRAGRRQVVALDVDGQHRRVDPGQRRVDVHAAQPGIAPGAGRGRPVADDAGRLAPAEAPAGPDAAVARTMPWMYGMMPYRRAPG